MAPDRSEGDGMSIRQLLTATEHAEAALLAFDREMQREPGGANNPCRDPETGRLTPKPLNVDNIHGEDSQRPTGNSAQAGLRRLRKAADGGDERAVRGVAP